MGLASNQPKTSDCNDTLGKKNTAISYLSSRIADTQKHPKHFAILRKRKQREGVSADPPTRHPFLECLSCCYEKAHLLLGNPGYGITKEPSPLLGTHAASVASE